ncbi:MAG: tetratricopeptide repeat protein, partial [Chitinophagaceae bacterium]
AIKNNPSNVALNISMGRLYLETGRKALADKTFEGVLNSLPKDEFKIRDVANAFYRSEEYDMAIRVFTEGRKLLSNERLFNFELISIYRFKKDKERLVQEYVESLGFMPEILFQAQNGISAVFDSNTDYQILQTILLRKIQKFPDKEVYTDMLVWGFLQQKDYEMALRQLIAQDKRTKAKGNAIYNAGGTFNINKAYTTAVKAFEYLLSKGKDQELYLPARVELVNTKQMLATSGNFNKPELEALATEYQAIIDEYGRSPRTLFASKRLANLQAYHLNQPKDAEKTLEQMLTIPGLPQSELAQIKLELGDIYVLNGEPWEAFLLYEQVARQFENAVTGNEANFKAARLSFYKGDFAYAKSQADALKASTSHLIANDALNLSLLISDNLQNANDSLALKMYADAEMLQFRNMSTEALNKLDSIASKYPGNSLSDDVMVARSKIYVAKNDVKEGAAILVKFVSEYPQSLWIDDVLFTLGDIYETRLAQPDVAKKYYEQLITDHPGSTFTNEARKRFRVLRGDSI